MYEYQLPILLLLSQKSTTQISVLKHLFKFHQSSISFAANLRHIWWGRLWRSASVRWPAGGRRRCPRGCPSSTSDAASGGGRLRESVLLHYHWHRRSMCRWSLGKNSQFFYLVCLSVCLSICLGRYIDLYSPSTLNWHSDRCSDDRACGWGRSADYNDQLITLITLITVIPLP